MLQQLYQSMPADTQVLYLNDNDDVMNLAAANPLAGLVAKKEIAKEAAAEVKEVLKETAAAAQKTIKEVKKEAKEAIKIVKKEAKQTIAAANSEAKATVK